MAESMYVVIYRTGGTENFKWNCSLGMEFRDAQIKSEEMTRAGFKNYIYEYSDYLTLGVPSTYEYVKGDTK